MACGSSTGICNVVDARLHSKYVTWVSEQWLKTLLHQVKTGQLSEDVALEQLRHLPFADVGDAKVDHHRSLRQGMPEVVFGEQKTIEQLVAIGEELMRRGSAVLMTRVAEDKALMVCQRLPQLVHNPLARTLSYVATPLKSLSASRVNVVTAGTSDLPVAEEARVTLALSGVEVRLITDVGVAGIHRLLHFEADLVAASANIVVAGMEGALASVVGGLVRGPVVAVPTSVGYGAALSGFAALLGMLTSCAAGVTVVNIDNGFGAAMAVVRLLQSAPGAGLEVAKR